MKRQDRENKGKEQTRRRGDAATRREEIFFHRVPSVAVSPRLFMGLDRCGACGLNFRHVENQRKAVLVQFRQH
jgi:hypothetical protein